jgi:SAM-dependent methyltransferase
MPEAAVFGEYARIYALLYADKDYAAEARFVLDLLATHAPGARTLLELGCGGGRHAALFAAAGLAVTGVDRSEAMLARARAHAATLPPAVAGRLAWARGDLRDLGDLPGVDAPGPGPGGLYDAVAALFHVVGYQTAEADLRAAFARAGARLAPGGVFVFDCWHGPCVEAEPPEVRIKRAEDDAVRVTRICEPQWDRAARVVTVNYEFFVQARASGAIDTFRERHPMRYLFEDEVRALLAHGGMELAASGQWMTGAAPGPGTFSVFYVGRKLP